MASEIEKPYNNVFNPFDCRSNEMPAHVLLMAKCVVMGLFLKGHIQDFPEIFLPFLPLFDSLVEWGLSPELFRGVNQVVFFVCTILLMLNVQVRKCCLILGLIILGSILAARGYYSNNKVFCGCLLLLAGLQRRNELLWLFRAQLVIMYFGAAFNKLCDSDWRTGQYFDYWLTNIVEQFHYTTVSAILPPLALAKVMSWSSIFIEMTLSVMFLFRRFSYKAVWIGILFHGFAMLIAHTDFGIFTIAILASYLSVIHWPSEIHVYGDFKNSVVKKIRTFFEYMDTNQIYRWFDKRNKLSNKGKDKKEAFWVVCDGKYYFGYRALKVLLFNSPITYFVIVLFMCLPDPSQRSRFFIIALLLLGPLIDYLEDWIVKRGAKQN